MLCNVLLLLLLSFVVVLHPRTQNSRDAKCDMYNTCMTIRKVSRLLLLLLLHTVCQTLLVHSMIYYQLSGGCSGCNVMAD